jgi:hypothetical protein
LFLILHNPVVSDLELLDSYGQEPNLYYDAVIIEVYRSKIKIFRLCLPRPARHSGSPYSRSFSFGQVLTGHPDVKSSRIHTHFHNRSGLAITGPWTSERISPDQILEFTGDISKKYWGCLQRNHEVSGGTS